MKPLVIQHGELFGKVAVVMGGAAAERKISIMSGTAVLDALKSQGVDAFGVDVGDNPIAELKEGKFDRALNIIHGRGGEDGIIQAIFECLKIPYSGSGVMASALSMDKLRTKLCWQGAGFKTPKWFVLKNNKAIDSCIEYLGFPVIVKPAQEGSSFGMSKATNKGELEDALTVALEFKCDVYAEAWVEGNEYTVGILNGEALPVIRLETANAFYDYQAKYESDETLYHCPCGLSPQQENELKVLALDACQVLGVKGWGRVDLFVDDKNVTQLIEVNTVPGMTDHSLVPNGR